MMIDDVTKAQAGDRAAFTRLVKRYSGMAVGYASGLVSDPETGRDVAQDAFVDAWLHLHQLQEPAAFGGWLRRIVFKHADRRTRTKAVLPPPAEPTKTPSDHLDARRRHEDFRRAIESLPEHERIVVALHYLGGAQQKEVAEFLELPLTTIKKRLHSARQRLAREDATMQPNETTTDLSDHIQLFLAIRASDHGQVRSVLDRRPDLVNTREQWSAREALAGGFPLAHRLTPLLLAAGRGDVQTVDALLERGAEVNGTCGCDAGESPLLAAALAGHADVVSRLIHAGADRTTKNRAGFDARSIAELRGHGGVLEVLGASDAAAHGDDQMSEVQRMSVGCGDDRYVTGIKAIDLLAPLRKGMLVRVRGAAETGLYVLLAELTRRFGDVTWATWEDAPHRRGELRAFAQEVGVNPQISSGITLSRVLFVFAQEGYESEVEANLPALRECDIAFVIDPWIPVTRGDRREIELAAPFDALIHTDPSLAERGIYPAIDPERTRSNLDVAHADLQAKVRRDPEMWPRFAQWFEVYRHQTGRAGETFTLAETLAAFS